MGAYSVKTLRLDASADGDNTVLAGVGNRELRVVSFVLTSSIAGLITIQDSTNVVVAVFNLGAQGGVSFAGSYDSPAFTLPQGRGLEVNSPAGLDCTGFINYVLI